MANQVTSKASSAEGMDSVPTSVVPGQSETKIGGPTNKNYKADDNSSKLNVTGTKPSKTAVNDKASALLFNICNFLSVSISNNNIYPKVSWKSSLRIVSILDVKSVNKEGSPGTLSNRFRLMPLSSVAKIKKLGAVKISTALSISWEEINGLKYLS